LVAGADCAGAKVAMNSAATAAERAQRCLIRVSSTSGVLMRANVC
jgi:hypothetical protein